MEGRFPFCVWKFHIAWLRLFLVNTTVVFASPPPHHRRPPFLVSLLPSLAPPPNLRCLCSGNKVRGPCNFHWEEIMSSTQSFFFPCMPTRTGGQPLDVSKPTTWDIFVFVFSQRTVSNPTMFTLNLQPTHTYWCMASMNGEYKH